MFTRGTIALGGNPDDAYIFESDIHKFTAQFGSGNDGLIVRGSEFG